MSVGCDSGKFPTRNCSRALAMQLSCGHVAVYESSVTTDYSSTSINAQSFTHLQLLIRSTASLSTRLVVDNWRSEKMTMFELWTTWIGWMFKWKFQAGGRIHFHVQQNNIVIFLLSLIVCTQLFLRSCRIALGSKSMCWPYLKNLIFSVVCMALVMIMCNSIISRSKCFS
jgi:hypothetical protein